MSELPHEARELLELAREGHEPPAPDARSRVRRGVAVAVAAGAGVALSGKAIAAGTKAVAEDVRHHAQRVSDSTSHACGESRARSSARAAG